MTMKKIHSRLMAPSLILVALLSAPSYLAAQTKIKAPRNFFSVRDDVQAGREAAADVKKESKPFRDAATNAYVQEVGRRLLAAIPPEFQHSEFRYTFQVLDDHEMNAFALPGGSVYVNRGLIESARSEGEMAGVLAHELSHVALRHGTAQVTKQLPALIALGVLSEVLGEGKKGQIVETAGMMGLSLYFMKFSRKYETQADILGAQIMSRAGYDPNDLANVFRALERNEGKGGPEWLSDHPNLRKRYDRIVQEISMMPSVAYAPADNSELRRIQGRLRGQ